MILVRTPRSYKPTYLGHNGSLEYTSRYISLLDLLDLYCFFLFISHLFFPFGFLIYRYSAVVEVSDMVSVGPLLCKWLGYTSSNPFWCAGLYGLRPLWPAPVGDATGDQCYAHFAHTLYGSTWVQHRCI